MNHTAHLRCDSFRAPAARAALYAIRYALHSGQAKALLLDPRRADDWIALTGPWVHWPQEIEAMFLDHLCKEHEAAPTDVTLKDLDAGGWSQLASVFPVITALAVPRSLRPYVTQRRA